MAKLHEILRDRISQPHTSTVKISRPFRRREWPVEVIAWMAPDRSLHYQIKGMARMTLVLNADDVIALDWENAFL